MSGRAGRAGKDTLGESILMIFAKEKRLAVDLMTKPLEPLNSCLSEVRTSFFISSRVASSVCNHIVICRCLSKVVILGGISEKTSGPIYVILFIYFFIFF